MNVRNTLLVLIILSFNVRGQDQIDTYKEDQIKESYEAWKEGQESYWQKWGKHTLLAKIFSLIPSLQEKLLLLKEIATKDPQEQQKLQVLYGSTFVVETQIDSLYEYNLLRELLGLSPIKSFSEISSTWVNQVAQEAEPYMYLEKTGYDLPQFGQTQLLKQAQKLLKLKQEILLFSHYDYDMHGISHPELTPEDKTIIALCRTPDVDEQLATLYHELGHVLMKTDDKETDIKKIDRYLEIGKRAFNNSTALGQHINWLLAEHTIFWAPPKDPQQKKEIAFQRNEEKLADLFEIENLFKQNQLSAILLDIANYATMQRSPVASPQDTYPSPFERALYMTGFLVDKGVEINKAFKEWYAKGICKQLPEETPDILFSQPLKSQGARDFIDGYTRWLDQNLSLEVNRLLSDIDFFLDRQQEHPSPTNKLELLKLYNYLRRRLHQTRVTSLKDIDQAWLKELSQKFSKKNLVIKNTVIEG